MSKLKLTLLGGYAGQHADGRPLELPTRKAWALLSYLALHPGQPVRRERLAALLWGDRFDEQARRSLRQTLYEVRGALGDGLSDALASGRDAVALDGRALAVDALRLEELAGQDEPVGPDEVESLYGGVLLDGLEAGEPGFDDWLSGERARFKELACGTLERLAARRLDSGEHLAGLETARRIVHIDPLRENGHRLLMRGLAAAGRRSQALKHYQELEKLLKAELGVAPDAETAQLRRALQDDQDPGPPAPPDPRRAAPKSEAARTRTGWRSWRRIAAAATVALAVGGAAGWYVSSRVFGPRIEPASVARMAFPLPSKPSVAVFPFAALGGDKQQQHLADGLTEDLTTTLSKVPHLFVIARRSTAAYRGRSVKVRQVAEQLGVRYVLKGSVRRMNGAIRVNAQLVDAIKGRLVWAERYDHKADGFFALQEDIIRRVVVALHITLTDGDNARIAGRGTKSLEAWLLRIQGMAAGYNFTRDGAARGRRLFQAAHKADPNWSRPLGGIAWTHWIDARFGYAKSRTESIRLGVGFAERAIALDPRDPLGYQQLGNLRALQGRRKEAIALREKAAELAPNDFNAVGGLACLLLYTDQSARALALLTRIRRLSPRYPAWAFYCLGVALHFERQYERSIAAFRDSIKMNPRDIRAHVSLAAVYADAGRMEEVRKKASDVLKRRPAFSVVAYLKRWAFQDSKRAARYQGLLLKAGLPK